MPLDRNLLRALLDTVALTVEALSDDELWRLLDVLEDLHNEAGAEVARRIAIAHARAADDCARPDPTEGG